MRIRDASLSESLGLHPLDRGHEKNLTGGLRTNVSGNGWSALRSDLRGTLLRALAPARADEDRPPLPRFRERAPWGGCADGGDLGTIGGQRALGGPRFNVHISANGYEWFYLDAVSDDRKHAMVIIGMLGNVFSPSYARARKNGKLVDPLNFSTMNVALYELGANGKKRTHWALTERGRHEIKRSETRLDIGPSRMQWEDGTLVVHLDEITAPFRTPLRGTVRVTPSAWSNESVAIDAAGKHEWRPYAPKARVSAYFSAPALSFEGEGYLDSNRGECALETSFREWTWSRMTLQDGSVVVAYDCTLTNGERTSDLRHLTAHGVHSLSPTVLETRPLPSLNWGLARGVRADRASSARMLAPLEDGPFYGRALVEATVLGQPAIGTHEVVSLERFDRAWVQFLLPFRMIDARAR